MKTNSHFSSKTLRNLLLAATLSSLGLGAIGCTGASVAVGGGTRAGVEIRVPGPPPGPRAEAMRTEAPSRRHVYVEGFWDWDPRRADWVWVPGGWVRPPRGHYDWVPPHHEQRGDGWIVIRGHWN